MQYCKEGRGRKGEPLSPLSVTRSRFHLCTAKALMEACWWPSGRVWHHDSLSGRMQSSNIAEYWEGESELDSGVPPPLSGTRVRWRGRRREGRGENDVSGGREGGKQAYYERERLTYYDRAYYTEWE